MDMKQKRRKHPIDEAPRPDESGPDAARDEMIRRAAELANVSEAIVARNQSRDSDRYLRENQQQSAE